jgi:hypothetical protein
MQLRLGRTARPDVEAARRERRVAPATVVALLFHVVIFVAVWNALQLRAVEDFFRDTTAQPVERVQFVTVQPSAPAVSGAARESSPPRTEPKPAPPPAPPLVAPREIPTTIPAPSAAPPAPTSAQTGPLVGGTGPTKGVEPTYIDPRVWVKNPAFLYAPKTDEERLDSALVTTIKRKQDSIAANGYQPNKFERGDWTVDHNGQKYGIDQQYIHLGKFSIPTALLAMLPFNKAAGPIDPERARTLSFQHSDLMYHAQAAITEQEFRDAVRAIRERKEREHNQQPQTIARKGDPHTIIAPGDRPPQ